MKKILSKFFVASYSTLPRQIKVLYLVTLLGELYFIIPVWMFFYLKFLPFEQIALITIIQQATAIVLEVPTGAFADMFGKKITLVISYLLYGISLVALPFGTMFSYFVVFEMLKGLAKALASGAFEALTYDTLVDQKKEGIYPEVSADITTISWLSYIFASILGGIMYDIWFGLPYIVLGLLYFGAMIILLLYIVEPKIDTITVSFRNYISQNISGIRELFKNAKISTVTVFLAVITFGYYTASELLGISQGKEYGMNGTQVGLLFTIGYIFSVIASRLFPTLIKRYHVTPIVFTTMSLLVVSFLFAKFVSPIVGAGLIILRIASSSTFSNTRSVVLNSSIQSQNRATALSSFTLLYELLYIGMAYFAGTYIGRHTPNEFAFLLGMLLLVVLVALSPFVWKGLKGSLSDKKA